MSYVYESIRVLRACVSFCFVLSVDHSCIPSFSFDSVDLASRWKIRAITDHKKTEKTRKRNNKKQGQQKGKGFEIENSIIYQWVGFGWYYAFYQRAVLEISVRSHFKKTLIFVNVCISHVANDH